MTFARDRSTARCQRRGWRRSRDDHRRADRLREHGITNVLLQEGDAAALPFLDESFDLVFCRFAVHHFTEPRRQLAEMARVCRAGGRVVISDLVAPDAELRRTFDDLHRQLDPSHVRAVPADELVDLTETLAC